MNEEQLDEHLGSGTTLDPPGSIAVIGSGPLGIEAALYGRYLGYDVTLIEAGPSFEALAAEEEAPIPMRPDRCASPLARSALAAQQGETGPRRSPTTMREWVEEVWRPLLETDLLRGRLLSGVSLIAVDLVPLDSEEEEDDVPPDFRLSLSEGEPLIFEAMITVTEEDAPCSFPLPTDYYFHLRGEGEDPESEFWSGLKQIVTLYASLGGRSDLDLYRPLRGG
ncbi:MAG: NAD-binding protein [Planctomycetota bacterium]